MSTPSLEPKIAAVTKDIKRKYLVRKLQELVRIAPVNATAILDYIISEQYTIKPATCENRIKCLIWLSEHHNHKPFSEMTNDDIRMFLGRVQKSETEDPEQRWKGSWNGRLVVLIRFFKWLHNRNEPDPKKRKTPACMVGIRHLTRKVMNSYKPSDMWDATDHEVFLKYCPSKRDRCYHAMAADMSARPHELLNLKIKDLQFKQTEDGTVYGEVMVTGKTGSRTLPMIDCLPYVKEWLQDHPTRGNPGSWLFISESHQNFGLQINRDGLWTRYSDYRKGYYPRLLTRPDLPEADKAIIRNLLTKPWNLYVFRHSALTEKCQMLPESMLRDHAGWSMSSDMPRVYLHLRGQSKDKILALKGVFKDSSTQRVPTKACPNCKQPNVLTNSVCSFCKMIITYDEYSEQVVSKSKRLEETEKQVQVLAKSLQRAERMIVTLLKREGIEVPA